MKYSRTHVIIETKCLRINLEDTKIVETNKISQNLFGRYKITEQIKCPKINFEDIKIIVTNKMSQNYFGGEIIWRIQKSLK